MAAWARLLAVAGGGYPYPVFRLVTRFVMWLAALTETMQRTVPNSGLVHICIISVRVICACRLLEIRLEILMKLSLCAALSSVFFAGLVPVAHAGNFSDAAIMKGEAGAATPSEMELLGSPSTYSDPYGAPTNGRGGQRGPITNAQTAAGVSPTDKLLAQQNGYMGTGGLGAQMKSTARPADAGVGKAPINASAQAAAASVYPTPAGLKPPTNANAAGARQIYKSPY
jgi:hypothetical protein